MRRRWEAALEARLLAAHAAGDTEGLAGLYAEAARMSQTDGEANRAAYFLTHAMVFALETGARDAEAYALQLRALGRHD